MSQSKTSSREEQARATREKITKAALELFSERGYAATSTRRIAKHAGISEGLIFHYFPNKKELLLGVAQDNNAMAFELQKRLEGAANKPVREVCETLSGVFVQTLRSDLPQTKLMRLLLGEAQTTPELAELFHERSSGGVRMLAAYLDIRKKEGEVAEEVNTSSAAHLFIGSFLWFFMTHQHLEDEEWIEQATRYSRDVVELWLKGISP